MQCKKVRKSLTAYLDGEIRGGLRERIERHIHVCPSCKKEVVSIEKIRSEMECMDSAPFPDSLSAHEILSKARFETAGKKREEGRERFVLPQGIGTRLWKPALGLASVLLVVALWRAYPLYLSLPVPTGEEMIVAERMELFEHLELFENLSILELMVSGEMQDGETG